MIISPGIGNSRGSDGSESLEKMNYGVCLSSGTMLSEVSMLSDNIDTWRKRLETAEEKAKEQEKLNARLREIFAQKIKEFRQDCYEITGYKITMTENGRKFRLRSMYAEREEDDLLFTKENEVLQVLETPFVSTNNVNHPTHRNNPRKVRGLESRVTEVLSRFNSIPLFLSSVTEYLFERQTRRT
jgi:mitotic spindle assembly checkpoint protein MAD1